MLFKHTMTLEICTDYEDPYLNFAVEELLWKKLPMSVVTSYQSETATAEEVEAIKEKVQFEVDYLDGKFNAPGATE